MQPGHTHRGYLIPLLIVLFFILNSIEAFGQDSLSERFLTAKAQMNRAFYGNDPEGLVEAMEAFKPFTESRDTEIKKLAYYYLGYSAYRLSSAFSGLNEDQTDEYLEEAVGYLEEATEIDYNFAEAVALLGNCYGMKASGFFSALKFGPKSDRTLQKAMQLAPGNPRVSLLYGISLMFKPGMFGGSLEKAIEEMKRSADLFKSSEPQNDLYPDWGREEVYAWLGQASERAERYDRAEEYYRMALEVNPDYYWVEEILLPELREKRG